MVSWQCDGVRQRRIHPASCSLRPLLTALVKHSPDCITRMCVCVYVHACICVRLCLFPKTFLRCPLCLLRAFSSGTRMEAGDVRGVRWRGHPGERVLQTEEAGTSGKRESTTCLLPNSPSPSGRSCFPRKRKVWESCASRARGPGNIQTLTLLL